MSIFLVKNPEKIKDDHLISAIENWDVVLQTVSYGYKLFGRGGIVNYKKEIKEAKDYYNLLRFRISRNNRDIEDDEISFSTSIIPSWDLFNDTDEALKVDGYLFNLAQSFDPDTEFYYSIVEKEPVYSDHEIDDINISLIGNNDLGSNIYIIKLPLSITKIEKLGIKVLSKMINKQSGADQKRLKLSRFLRKKRIEFHKT